MHFASGIVRPPFEAGCEFLQVTSGCSHDSCRFCTFYKDARFAISDLDEVNADLDELSRSPWRHYNRIWLQGADAFVLPYDRLMEIAELIYEKLPWVTSIGAFARVTNFRNKSVEQLKALAAAGYSRLTVGIETGDDELLSRMMMADWNGTESPSSACEHLQWKRTEGFDSHSADNNPIRKNAKTTPLGVSFCIKRNF